MQERTMAAMSDELAKMGGLLSGVGKFLSSGVKGFGQLGNKAGRAGLLNTARNLPSQLRAAYQHGGGISGVGRVLARSQPVQMAAMGAGGLYAGNKALGMVRGNQQPQQ